MNYIIFLRRLITNCNIPVCSATYVHYHKSTFITLSNNMGEFHFQPYMLKNYQKEGRL